MSTTRTPDAPPGVVSTFHCDESADVEVLESWAPSWRAAIELAVASALEV